MWLVTTCRASSLAPDVGLNVPIWWWTRQKVKLTGPQASKVVVESAIVNYRWTLWRHLSFMLVKWLIWRFTSNNLESDGPCPYRGHQFIAGKSSNKLLVAIVEVFILLNLLKSVIFSKKIFKMEQFLKDVCSLGSEPKAFYKLGQILKFATRWLKNLANKFFIVEENKGRTSTPRPPLVRPPVGRPQPALQKDGTASGADQMIRLIWPLILPAKCGRVDAQTLLQMRWEI